MRLRGRYLELYHELARQVPRERLIHDELRTLACGTDASFYRLIPKLVVKVESESEVAAVLRACRRRAIPLTFRAAGTSLAGQAITDSVLVLLGRNWKKIEPGPDGSTITLQPGVIGSHANQKLLPFGRKLGPDPASINAAMIGGIVANNSSGMCCSPAQDSYHTIAGMRIMLADGTILDTRDPESREAFRASHAALLAGLLELARRIRSDAALAGRIRRKYRIKNTTGYSLHALVDFEDPIEILQHLMVGSEGTLGFISEVTYRTVPELPLKATSLMLFPDIATACRAIAPLREAGVSAAELMDRASLRSVEGKQGMPEYLRELGEEAAALLVEVRAADAGVLAQQIRTVCDAVQDLPTVRPLRFTTDVAEYTQLWNIRKGLLPSAGAMRPAGTTVIMEDVAFPTGVLDRAALECGALFRKHGYENAITFGHALQGNLHFVFPQDLGTASEVERFARFMDDLCRTVVFTYDGSLKAEHGTGRNIAPYVEMEWGAEARGLMREIKRIFDPDNCLNPGVILNEDPRIHLKNLKPLPPAHPLVDKCIECGFCESTCPSRDLTLTPRQRIVVWREISRPPADADERARRRRLRRDFDYAGDRTCATDGLCALACPVEIDTGKLIKHLRAEGRSRFAHRLADLAARRMAAAAAGLRAALDAADCMHRLLGTGAMLRAARAARRISFGLLPMWNAALPPGGQRVAARPIRADRALRAVYFPSCLSRSMGPPPDGGRGETQIHMTEKLLRKAGYETVYPAGLDALCCGMAFASKGFTRQGDLKLRELEAALEEASEGGRLPILFDTSPCLWRWREAVSQASRLRVHDPATFIDEFLREHLRFRRLPQTVALHVTCSARKMGLADRMRALAELCAEKVVVPEEIGCCGFAGDRGFTVPELNAAALAELKSRLPAECRSGYSTSRTCEIGLSLHGGIPYRSLVYLVDEATEAAD